MTAIRITPFVPSALEVVYRVFATATPDQLDREATGFLVSQYSLDGFRDFLVARQAYVAYQGDIAIGFAVVALPTLDQMEPIRWFGTPVVDAGDGNLLWIKMVAVLPTHKRQGVATALYQHLFQMHLQTRFITGLYEVPIHNRASSEFHLALGFQRVGVIERIRDAAGADTTTQSRTGIYYRSISTNSSEVNHVS